MKWVAQSNAMIYSNFTERESFLDTEKLNIGRRPVKSKRNYISSIPMIKIFSMKSVS